MQYMFKIHTLTAIIGIAGIESTKFLSDFYIIEKIILELTIGLVTVLILIHKVKKNGRDKTNNQCFGK